MAGKTKAEKAAEALLAKAIELSGVTADVFAALSEEERAGFTARAQKAIAATAVEAKQEKVAKTPAVDDSHLIKVSKDGVDLSVHPTTLAAHKALGWQEA